MTSPKSSINPRLYTFRTALTSNFLMPLLNMAALAFCIPVMNLIRILSINNAAASPRQGETVVSLKETYRYLLMGDAEFAPLAILAVVGCSVLLGVMMFRFIASKKTVNVFYSLGITRKSPFCIQISGRRPDAGCVCRFTIAVQSHSQLFLSGLFLAALERNGLLFLELFDLGLFFFYGDGSGVQLRGHCGRGLLFPICDSRLADDYPLLPAIFDGNAFLGIPMGNTLWAMAPQTFLLLLRRSIPFCFSMMASTTYPHWMRAGS